MDQRIMDHCTSQFKRAVCISCRQRVDVHKGRGPAHVDACGQGEGVKTLIFCGRHKLKTPKRTSGRSSRDRWDYACCSCSEALVIVVGRHDFEDDGQRRKFCGRTERFAPEAEEIRTTNWMRRQWTDDGYCLSLDLSLSVSVCLSVCLRVCMSICICICLSLRGTFFLS